MLTRVTDYGKLNLVRKDRTMTNEQRLAIMKNKLNMLEGTPKNIKCGGVVRALKREIRNLEDQISSSKN